MNGEQLFQTLQAAGLDFEEEGHSLVLLDVWTSRVMSATFHPEDGVKSVTIWIAACEMEAMQGTLLAGGFPTVHGDVLDDWQDVCNKAIDGATLVATAYCTQMFEAIGFSPGKFLDSDVAKAMTPEARSSHMDMRLNQGATAKFVNRMGTRSLDLEGDERQAALKAMEKSDMYLDVVAKALAEVDGQ